MTQPVDQLLAAALALPEVQRAQLVEALIATLAPDDATPLDDTWLAEIERRSAEFDAGGVETLTWTEVKERARQRCAQRD